MSDGKSQSTEPLTMGQLYRLLGRSPQDPDMYRSISKLEWTRTRALHIQMCSYASAWDTMETERSSLARTPLDEEMYAIAFRRF